VVLSSIILSRLLSIGVLSLTHGGPACPAASCLLLLAMADEST
jgi:hypothetical protein